VKPEGIDNKYLNPEKGSTLSWLLFLVTNSMGYTHGYSNSAPSGLCISNISS